MKKAILVAIIGVFALSANAGDWGKAPVPAKAPIEECLDVGGEISAGYMTDYIFYGQRLARDSVWTDVNYTFDNFIVPINIGAWYLNGIGESIGGVAPGDELDLYISAELGTFAGFDVSLGYVHYLYPETVGVGSYGEVGLDISRSLGFVDFAWESNYGLMDRSAFPNNGGGWYHQASLSKTFGLTDAASLVLTGGVGYADGYWNSGYNTANGWAALAGNSSNGWNHYFFTAELPIELNCRATLTPYIGYVGAPDGWVMDGAPAIGANSVQSDILHGGVSLSVSF